MKHPTNRLERKLIEAKKRKNKGLSAREKEYKTLLDSPPIKDISIFEPEIGQ